jgi:hypothetical protein
MNTGCCDNSIWFNLYNMVECKANVRTIQRLEIAFVEYNTLASKSCISHIKILVYAKRRVRTVCRDNNVVILGRYRSLYEVPGSLKPFSCISIKDVDQGKYILL